MKGAEEGDELSVRCWLKAFSFLATALAEVENSGRPPFLTFWGPSRGTCYGVARKKILADAHR